MSDRKAKSESQKSAVPEIAPNPASKQSGTSQFTDNRPEAVAQRKLQEMANKSPQVKQTEQSQEMANTIASAAPVQRKNNTGLPDQLKSGIENLSGYSMDDVKVHRNSDKPAQLNAHAFAQGSEIHLASGQEKHLPHEAWHVVQQKQGRVKPTVQMKNNPSAKAKKGVNINDDPGLEKEADIMGAKAARNSEEKNSEKPLQKVPLKSTSHPSQLKKESDLKPGVFNMIGETHNYYKDKKARAYDAQKIKEKLGGGTQYYTEGILKTKKSNKDFSDPVDLRLEQVISFVQEHCNFLLPKLLGIDTGKLNIEATELGKGKGSISAIPGELTPTIMSSEFNLEAMMQLIKKKNLSGDQLEALAETDVWNRDQVDPEDKFEDNFDALENAIFRYAFEVQQQELKLSKEPVVPDEIPKAKEVLNLNMSAFYNEFKDRLPPSLKFYLHLKNEGHYVNSRGNFEFALDKIPTALHAWAGVKELLELIHLVHSGNRIDLLKMAIETSIDKIRTLLAALNAGMEQGAKNRPSDDVRVDRSMSMHEAAEALKGKNIAWKVGDLHVKDIQGLEEGNIIKTNYAYVSEGDFVSKNLKKSEMDTFDGGDLELGAAHVEAEKSSAAMLTNAEAILADPVKLKEALFNAQEWNAIFATIEHLDLSNLITNMTGIVVKQILKGKMPKLKTITIPKLSMTPDLNGKLIGYGIQVNLV